jgi:hypothetical protein
MHSERVARIAVRTAVACLPPSQPRPGRTPRTNPSDNSRTWQKRRLRSAPPLRHPLSAPRRPAAPLLYRASAGTVCWGSGRRKEGWSLTSGADRAVPANPVGRPCAMHGASGPCRRSPGGEPEILRQRSGCAVRCPARRPLLLPSGERRARRRRVGLALLDGRRLGARHFCAHKAPNFGARCGGVRRQSVASCQGR